MSISAIAANNAYLFQAQPRFNGTNTSTKTATSGTSNAPKIGNDTMHTMSLAKGAEGAVVGAGIGGAVGAIGGAIGGFFVGGVGALPGAALGGQFGAYVGGGIGAVIGLLQPSSSNNSPCPSPTPTKSHAKN